MHGYLGTGEYMDGLVRVDRRMDKGLWLDGLKDVVLWMDIEL